MPPLARRRGANFPEAIGSSDHGKRQMLRRSTQ